MTYFGRSRATGLAARAAVSTVVTASPRAARAAPAPTAEEPSVRIAAEKRLVRNLTDAFCSRSVPNYAYQPSCGWQHNCRADQAAFSLCCFGARRPIGLWRSRSIVFAATKGCREAEASCWSWRWCWSVLTDQGSLAEEGGRQRRQESWRHHFRPPDGQLAVHGRAQAPLRRERVRSGNVFESSSSLAYYSKGRGLDGRDSGGVERGAVLGLGGMVATKK